MSKIIKEQIKVREGKKEIIIRILRARGGEKNILSTKQEQVFSFLSSMMLAVSLSYMTFITLR